MNTLWFLVYNIIIYPLLIFIFTILSIINGKVRSGFIGRFSTQRKLNKYFSKISINSNIYWFHAASLGEFNQLLPVLEGVKKVEPDSVAIVSFFSSSGYQNASSNLMDLKIYLPFDFLWSVNKALDTVSPKKLVFATYDLWPNLIWSAKRKNIHTNIFASRIKDDSYKMKPIFRIFYQSIYRSFSTIYTISEKDRSYLSGIIGKANTPRLRVLGNPRFDMVKKSADSFLEEKKGDILSRDTRLILASMHDEDDQTIFPAVWELLKIFPKLKILYVPHEPSSAVVRRYRKVFQGKGFEPYTITDKKNSKLPDARVVIIGIVGILPKLYWQGKIAYIGGGFSTGIHNVMEPAVAGLPVIFGPDYKHFQEAEDLLDSGGGFTIDSNESFRNTFESLFTNEEYFLESSTAAKNVIERNLGSANRIVGSIIND